MAHIAASQFRPRGGAWKIPEPRGNTSLWNSKMREYLNTKKALENARIALANARRAYNSQKRSVSGGARNWFRRRFSQQARTERNSKLNANLKIRLNAAKRAYENAERKHFNSKWWYNHQPPFLTRGY
jgi:predicted phosphohydrolase